MLSRVGSDNMPQDLIFRGIFLLVFLSSIVISGYHRKRARRSGEVIPRRAEGTFVLLIRMGMALLVAASFLAYAFAPEWLAWSTLSLPAWLRWGAGALAVACLPALWWVLVSIGENISETVLTKANRNDITQLLPLVEAIPHLAGKPGRPLHKPECVQGDRGYDSQPHRNTLQERGIRTELAKRGTPHGSGLGKTRWVVERSIAWLHQFRRLRIRYERRPSIHEAFLKLGCALICWRFLRATSFC